MRLLSITVFVVTALAAGLTAAQEIAGRVLVVAGELNISRGAERIAARSGTLVRPGDTLATGAQSNAQVMMTDQSIIAMRPDTSIRIADYAFKDQPIETQRSFYEMLKGGMRTVSGLIGKSRPENYTFTTPTAVMGIRGTNYALVVCAQSCTDADGKLAPDGTYGTVTDGRISVTNLTGESVFGANQYFTVASQNERPVQLLAPPAFLRDTLAGRGRVKSDSKQAAQDSAATAQSASAPAGDASITSAIAVATAPANLTSAISLSTTAAATEGLAAVAVPTSNGTVYYRQAGGTAKVVACDSPPCGSFTVVAVTLGVNLSLQRATASVVITTQDGATINLVTPLLPGSDGIPVTVSGGVLRFSQTFNRVDYPNNAGAFRCQDCGANGTSSFLDKMTFSGTISGSTASLTLSGSAGTGFATVPFALTQTALPNNFAASAVIPTFGGGAVTTGSIGFGLVLDSAGKLLSIGPDAGALRAAVGTSTNVLLGSSVASGNLVWGYFSGAGAQLTDANYRTFTTTAAYTVPWITGTSPNTLPPSLGTLTYAPAGGFVNAGSASTLNSGSLTADFVNRSLNISLNATNVGSRNTFQLNGTTGISAISPRFGAAFSTVTCTGPCAVGVPGGNFNGFFSGANAEGVGVSFTAGYGTGGGVTGVTAFKH